MSNISASDVKALRERTGAGMSDCKKALEESNGNIEQSIDWLKKRGQKLSLKRADKEASEGAIFAAESKSLKKAAMIVLACETDFVAKTDLFL
jgi:elongation factor Ts